ncbi:sushi, von Willebrand factor type A, EGF and pentraxin domain-containing protein 1-like [Chrysoperla carnea]|uniref:sushi, von Willebrand factor type A, EGF and pentraxin domain-containing protein 1-like n=1 Tax=Chrysoperla carnea TaxID=189513 RepID=UPI001D0682B5|nr:sushi, von Willebrand factor type A, EGF and pentraxin domain-containing protein 1-like [Chrysoperla carnea]
MTTEVYGSQTVDACFQNITNFCQNESICNSGICILDGSNYFCKCPDNYFGSHCEIPFNSCTSNPCFNNGKCISNFEYGNYTCDCAEGYQGTTCEMEHCVKKFCRNGGTCIREDSQEFCICDQNFYGEFCERIENYCLYNFCENNSTCVESYDDYKCICKNGFLGKRCHILPCDYLPCSENATCINQDHGNITSRNSYKCECPLGFEGPNCLVKIDYCAKFPCLNHGICINMENNFKCGCIVPFTGKICETKLDSNFMLSFSQSSITDFVKLPGPLFSLSEISTCLWIQTFDTDNYGTMISYATKEYDNAFTITDYNGIVLYINNDFKVTDIFLNDGRWHFLCITWSSFRGEYSIYVDGELKESGHNFGTKQKINGNGTFVLGQEQDVQGGKFSQAESFTGKMTNLDMWYRTLNQNEVLKFYETCHPYYGNLLFWGEIRSYISGNVQIEHWPFCGICVAPKSIKNGVVIVENNVATYTCRSGFRLYYKGTYHDQISRICTKTTEWEGIIEPTCQIVECNYPNMVENGFFIGSHFEYGNTIIYHCNEGYRLVGELVLHCLESGHWSSPPPYCLGPQCPSLEQPGNSRMTIFLYKRSHIIKNTFDVGTKIEFKCLDGTYLEGESLITCMENETWSSNVPMCKEIIVDNTESFKVRNSVNSKQTTLIAGKELKFDFKLSTIKPIATEKVIHSNILTESTFASTDQQMDDFRSSTNTDIVTDKVLTSDKSTESIFTPTDKQMEDLRLSTTTEIVQEKVSISSESAESSDTTTDRQMNDFSFSINTNIVTEKFLISSKSTESKFTTTDKPMDDFRLSTNNDITMTTESSFTTTDEVYYSRLSTTKQNFTNVLRILAVTAIDNVTETTSHRTIYSEIVSENVPATITTQINELPEIFSIDDVAITDEDYSTIMMNTVMEPVFCESTILPQNPLHTTFLIENLHPTYEVGTKLEFQCQPGFKYVTVNFTECLANGLWSINEYFCKPIVCKLPPRPKVMVLLNEKSSYKTGDIVNYACNDGFKGYGKGSIRCLPSGSWTRILLRCAKISCGKPKLLKEARIIGNSFLYMDTVKIECLEYSTKKVFEIQCYPNGKWMPNVEC